jgi:hypothetical protein
MARCAGKYLVMWLLSLCLIVLISTTSYAAASYIVKHKITPIVEDPKLKHEISDRGLGILGGIKNCVVLGNIIEAESVKGRKFRKWLQIKADGKTLGFVERKTVARLPKFEKMKPEKFWIKKAGVRLFLAPGNKPLSRKYVGITLPYGMSVVGVGSYKRGRVSWTLLRFDYNDPKEASLGIGDRYGWVKTSQLQRL